MSNILNVPRAAFVIFHTNASLSQMVRLVAICVALFFLVASCSCEAPKAWTASEFPNPTQDVKSCGREGASMSWICDPDGVMTTYEKDALEETLKDIYVDRSRYPAAPGRGDNQGYQVAIALMRHVGGSGGPDARAKKMAMHVHDTWGVGDTSGSGILLMFAIGDRQMFFSRGASAGKIVSDDTLDLIQGRITPHLKNGNYSAAVLAATSDIGDALAGRLVGRSTSPSRMTIGIALCALVVTWRIVNKYTAWEYSEFRRKLSKLEEDAARARANGFAATSCPVCMEDFKMDTLQSEGGGLEREFLRCGHTFCTPCINTWLKKKTTCPVCRADVTSTPSRAPSRPRPQNWDDFEPEYIYRVNRMHETYPQYVSRTTAKTWVDQGRCPSPTSKAKKSSTRSFGGGSSSGGRGKSW